MHRPLEKGSCVGGGVVTASLSPPGVTLRMEDDSSEVGNGFVPFSTSEATTGGGSLFVMTDMVTEWTQFPPTKYKGVQLPCGQCPQTRLTTSAQQQRGLTSLLKNCRNTKNGGEMKKTKSHHLDGGKRLPQNPTTEAALGKAPMVGRDVGGKGEWRMQQEALGYPRRAKTATTREPGHLLSAKAAVGFGTPTARDGWWRDGITSSRNYEERRNSGRQRAFVMQPSL